VVAVVMIRTAMILRLMMTVVCAFFFPRMDYLNMYQPCVFENSMTVGYDHDDGVDDDDDDHDDEYDDDGDDEGDGDDDDDDDDDDDISDVSLNLYI